MGQAVTSGSSMTMSAAAVQHLHGVGTVDGIVVVGRVVVGSVVSVKPMVVAGKQVAAL